MCQPGRPAPQGEPQDGSWGFAAFHSAKSLACRLSESTANDKWSISRANPDQHHSGHRTGGTHARVRCSEKQPHVSPASLSLSPMQAAAPTP